VNRSFVSVELFGEPRLLPLEQVQEILPMVALQEVTLDDPDCIGMLDLRGQVLPVYAPGAHGPPTASHFIVVSSVDSEPIGLVVQDVGDVVHLDRDAVVRRSTRGREVEVGRLETGLVPLIDLAEVLGRND
jgi:chemotaxis signal transduction protein